MGLLKKLKEIDQVKLILITSLVITLSTYMKEIQYRTGFARSLQAIGYDVRTRDIKDYEIIPDITGDNIPDYKVTLRNGSTFHFQGR